MPIATIDPNQYQRHELKSAPADPNIPDDENGYEMLRPLPFGMILQRADETLQMQMKARRPQDRRRKGGTEEMPNIDMKSLNRKSAEIDFAYCIGDHNLTDNRGVKLDFANPLVFQVLDPRIAQEIQEYIDELNNPEGTESAEDFIKRVTSSPGEKDEQKIASPTEASNIEPQTTS